MVLLHGLFVLFGLALLLFTEIRVARDEKGGKEDTSFHGGRAARNGKQRVG